MKVDKLPSDQKACMLKLLEYGYVDYEGNLKLVVEHKCDLNAIIMKKLDQ